MVPGSFLAFYLAIQPASLPKQRYPTLFTVHHLHIYYVHYTPSNQRVYFNLIYLASGRAHAKGGQSIVCGLPPTRTPPTHLVCVNSFSAVNLDDEEDRYTDIIDAWRRN